MGAKTGIEWADATVNVWEGCTKISPACKHCYAETNSPVRAMEVRIGEALQVEPSADGKRRLKMWGQNGFRYETANWERELLALNRKAQRERKKHVNATASKPYVRPRVFINSLSDAFEDWQGAVYALEDGKFVVVAQSLDGLRERFFRVAEECTELDILLLTKRPENVYNMVPNSWRVDWRSWVWIGTTVEDQEHADKRIPELLKVPAKVRFLSMEPLLGKVDLGRWLKWPWFCEVCSVVPEMHAETHLHCHDDGKVRRQLNWIIVGGESGNSVRPMDTEWVRSIRDQCVAAGVPFFFKQYAARKPKVLGRVFDGRTWDEVPR